MKVAIIGSALDNQNAGIHYYTKGLISSLENGPFNGSLLIIRSKKSNEFPTAQTITVPEYNFPGWASFRLFVLIPWLLKKHQVDVVIEPGHFGPFNLPRGIKRVTVMHDLTPILFPEFHTFAGSFLQKLFLSKILKKADLILANSNHTQQDLERHYPVTKGKIIRIYPGIDPLFKPQLDEAKIKSYGILASYFLFVGTLEPRKNLIALLELYEKYRNSSEEWVQLVLVGQKGWKMDDFFIQLERHPYKKDILLPGYVPREDLPILYSHCQKFLYLSVYEGYGFPPLEAAACGANCLVNKNSSLKELPNLASGIEALPCEHWLENLKNREIASPKDHPPSWSEFGIEITRSLSTLDSEAFN